MSEIIIEDEGAGNAPTYRKLTDIIPLLEAAPEQEENRAMRTYRRLTDIQKEFWMLHNVGLRRDLIIKDLAYKFYMSRNYLESVIWMKLKNPNESLDQCETGEA